MTGLQTARLLAGHDIPVIAIARDPNHFCCRTNVCQKILITDTKSEELIRLLEALGPGLGEKAVLYPCTDMSVLLLSKHRQRLAEWYYLALPDNDVVEMLVDKIRFYHFAKDAGLPLPGTLFLKNRADAEQAARELNFPFILKPPFKTITWEQNTKAKVYKVKTAEEFLELYDRCSSWADLLMVQEWIEGPDANLYSCNCYFNASHQPLVTFIARKLRQWPPETGTSCLGEEVRNDEVLEVSVRLFEKVNYFGLGYVEMKRDERTGKSYIIEPNIGRPTGRSAIAEAGGVELLYTMYCDLLGWPLPPNREQKYQGVKWIYWRHDVQSALHYLLRGELTPAGLIRSWRGRKACAIYSRTDPAPFWHDLFRNFNRLFNLKRTRAHKAEIPGKYPLL
jgi:predicted ATP-grasp superfamily ATP-dependent carboligase